MSAITLENTTGKRSGRVVCYEYGEDLFGYLFLDIYSGKKHKTRRVNSRLFQRVRDLIIYLDDDLYRKEILNYLPIN